MSLDGREAAGLRPGGASTRLSRRWRQRGRLIKAGNRPISYLRYAGPVAWMTLSPALTDRKSRLDPSIVGGKIMFFGLHIVSMLAKPLAILPRLRNR